MQHIIYGNLTYVKGKKSLVITKSKKRQGRRLREENWSSFLLFNLIKNINAFKDCSLSKLCVFLSLC